MHMKLTVKFNLISGDKMHISGYLSPGIGRGKKRNFEDDGNAYIWIWWRHAHTLLSKFFKLYL